MKCDIENYQKPFITNYSIRKKLIAYISINLILFSLFLLSCTTKYSHEKGTVKDIDDFYLHVVKSADPITDLILKTENYYDQNNLKVVKKFCEEFKRNNLLQEIYVSNLMADILTYHEVDIERAFNINNFILSSLRKSSENERLAYSTTYEKCRYPTGSDRGFAATMVPIFAVVEVVTTPLRLLSGEKAGLTKRAVDDARGKPQCKKNNYLERTNLRNKFFDISIHEIRKMSMIRLVYLNELIGDFNEADSWLKKLKQK